MKNYTKIHLQKTLTILSFLFCLNSFSQYGKVWEKNYGGSLSDSGATIEMLKDSSGFISSGIALSSDYSISSQGYGDIDYWLLKTDNSGNIIWEKKYGGSDVDWVKCVTQTNDGGFIVGGYSESSDYNVSNNYGQRDIWIVKLDSLGNIEWEKNYGGSDFDDIRTIKQLDNGSFIFFGHTWSNDFDVSQGPSSGIYHWVVNIDSVGNIIWEKTLLFLTNPILDDFDQNNILITNTNKIIFTTNSVNSVNSIYVDGLVVCLDSLGNLIWTHPFSGSNSEEAKKIIETNDGSYAFLISSKSNDNDFPINMGGKDAWLVKIDTNGLLQWKKHFGGSGDDVLSNLKQKANGNYILGGYSYSQDIANVQNYGSADIWIIETDPLGNEIWTKNFGTMGYERVRDFTLDKNNNIVIMSAVSSISYDASNNFGGMDMWILKLKPFMANIYGNIIIDFNGNCIYDNGDTTLNNAIVEATNIVSNQSYYDVTNQGVFSINTDTINHLVTFYNPSLYFESAACSQDTQIAFLNSTNLSDTLNYFIQPNILCPYMGVDISTISLRRCFSTDYNISYCNNGTEIANNAFIEIEFDPILTINSSSIPWTTVVGNTYTFPIGNIEMFACGNFSVNVSVPCDSTTFLGQILCTEVHIFPDTICLPSSNTWNGAELQAKAECVGIDSIEVTLKNIGNGDMNGDVPIMVIEDVILIMDSLGQLDAGNEIKWTFPTNGIETHRIIAQQPNDHPFRTFTTDAVANCNLTASAGPPPAQDSAFLAYPNDDEAAFIAVDCQPIIGSFDPNDKTVYPTGFSSEHFISEKTDLEYKIRFQNTGTDTAFLVVITDSISDFLDITTIKPGASSHSYQFDIFGTGVVKFTFHNILLPDSFVDEPASHGFVQYKIKQKIGNQVGNLILNNADIFFDYNLPVRTNTAFSEIGGVFLDTIIYKFPSIIDGIEEVANYNIKVYPNPAKDYMYFEFENSMKNVSIELYDLSGKLQHKTIAVNSNKLKMERNNLPSGMYLFKIYSEEKELAYGKLVFK